MSAIIFVLTCIVVAPFPILTCRFFHEPLPTEKQLVQAKMKVAVKKQTQNVPFKCPHMLWCVVRART